ncbi:MAG: hypothetical protein JRN68_08495 [Nitrososphaerota archaeon]|nr:hypothetical protein [Nitrososphaerota archaeon]
MPSVPLTYVIGTIGMLAILGIVTLISTETGLSIGSQSAVSNLQDAAQYTATELNTIATTAMASPGETVMFHVSMPKSINSNGYGVNLTKTSSGWEVVAFLISTPSVKATALLNFQAAATSSNLGVCVYSLPGNPAGCPTPPSTVNPVQTLYSGALNEVVWASGNSSGVTVGIGELIN